MRWTATLAFVVALTGCTAESGFDRSVCLDVPAEKVEALASGLTVQGGGSLTDAQAVRHDQTWLLVSARIRGPGIEEGNAIGTWAVTSLDPGGMHLAANAQAEAFSEWGAIAGTRAGGVERAPGAAESRRCVTTQ